MKEVEVEVEISKDQPQQPHQSMEVEPPSPTAEAQEKSGKNKKAINTNKNATKKNKSIDESIKTSCNLCQTKFDSKTALFRHLRSNSKNCIPETDLSKDEYTDFLNPNKNSIEKIAVLYGYIPDGIYLQRGSIYNTGDENADDDALVADAPRKENSCKENGLLLLRGGEDASRLLSNVIWEVGSNMDITSASSESNNPSVNKKVTRSFGSTSRTNSIISQDAYTGAVTELLSTKAPCIVQVHIKKWIVRINKRLEEKLLKVGSGSGRIRVFGRMKVPNNFNPELHTTQRRMAYLLPADFLYTKEVKESMYPTIQSFFNNLPSFLPDNNPSQCTTISTNNEDENITFSGASKYNTKGRPNETTLPYLYKLKKIMQKLCTQTQVLDVQDDGKVMEKEWAKRHRKKQKNKEKRPFHNNNKATSTTATQPSSIPEKQHVLCRKRYHNFTKNVMAHEFLAYRRIDRFYHRATVRFITQDPNNYKLIPPSTNTTATSKTRPYFLMQITGDQFLTGQIQGVIGLFLALIHDTIPLDYIDCVFDEQYPHLLSVPCIPSCGLYASDAMYSNWEGKLQCILTPRCTNKKFEKTHENSLDWKKQDLLDEIHDWEQTMLSTIAKSWSYEGEDYSDDTSTTLNAKTIWLEQVLKPWGIKANIQLLEYRQWKLQQQQQLTTTNSTIPPSMPSLNTKFIIPELYKNVLYHLQQIDSLNLWPNTSLKRQLVMVSTPQNQNLPESQQSQPSSSLSVAHYNAKSTTTKTASPSPYSLKEGQGGASGSFSIGYTPDKNGSQQPKSNALFPELVKSAFALEVALNISNRCPSSTIAINRNAQFRPHLDSGIGTGQSKSLIVGFGSYTGGELCVDKKGKIDIQYKPFEFDGWKERHWTMPFVGERYSLVWFTPLGCDGSKGIDLFS